MPNAAVDGRRVPRQERAMLTREHILDTAAQLFTERGIANTSTNRIAAEAGVSIGTLYRYFADRTVIVQELIQRLMASGEKHFRQSVLDRDGETILEVATIALEVMTDEIMSNAGLVRALVAGAQYYSSGISEFEPRLLEVSTNLVSHAFGDGDELLHDAMATAMVNTTFAAVLRAATLDSDSGDHREVAQMTARLIAAAAQAELAARHPPAR
ncbi:TetR family transcriptional regulator [Nocardia nova]|uniref:TetR family transcriptional regulator n=1 Tax=Nocardia nova TaxID=37330 RepID=A0A2S6AGV2_9NOCA|nr:TetR family transcriptional regulator [Nocardia nova]PPJ33980.1 TetR family transcriptional regulator [Nocardia nova]